MQENNLQVYWLYWLYCSKIKQIVFKTNKHFYFHWFTFATDCYLCYWEMLHLNLETGTKYNSISGNIFQFSKGEKYFKHYNQFATLIKSIFMSVMSCYWAKPDIVIGCHRYVTLSLYLRRIKIKVFYFLKI